MNLSYIINWEGYGLSGVVLTILGSGLTIYFARSAKLNSERAADAAENTRSLIKTVDSFSECKLIEMSLREIVMRMDNSEWDRVSDSAQNIRTSTSLILSTLEPPEDSALRDALVEIRTQMQTLHDSATKQYHGRKDADPVLIKRRVSSLSERLTEVQAELRRTVER